MKVVICDNDSGFGLSPKAYKRLAELQGDELYFYYYDYDSEKYIKTTENYDGYKPLSMSYTNIGEEILARDLDELFYEIDIKRNDPLLIQVVEELGEEAGDDIKLKTVEIPDDVEWEINADYGVEIIVEKHRRWY